MTERAEKLMRYSKQDLAERCDVLERNIKALKEGIEIQYQNCLALFDAKSLVYKTMVNLVNLKIEQGV